MNSDHGPEIPRREPHAARPTLVLILGTDASGKDHVARLALEHLRGLGVDLEKRRGWLSARACEADSSEHKGAARLLAERFFLRAYPLMAPAIPLALTLCIRADIMLFRKFRNGPAMVVSHTALRLLAFHMGHDDAFRMPAHLRKALAELHGLGLETLLVTTERHVRLGRIRDRIQRDKVDHFDLYMARLPDRAERVTDSLERIALEHLRARPIRNDTHGDSHIAAALSEIWPAARPAP